MSGQIPPNSFLVDIFPVLQQKIDSILAYESQFPPHKRQFIDQIKLHNQHFGSLMGSGAAELLMLPRLLHLDVLDIFKV